MSAAPPLQDFLNQLPHLPGVYRMLDAAGKVLYVGKAKNLQARVKSYFHGNEHSPRIKMMTAQIASIDITITRSEAEALILENNLIKSLHPKYNIIFRDDKSYPFIKLSAHTYPQISYYRGKLNKPDLYFGPYPNAYFLRESIQLIQKIFGLRTCDDSTFNHRQRPCLLYQIKRCSAPCVGLINPDAYQQNVTEANLFLQGKTTALLRSLTAKMEEEAAKQNYETAAKLRDQIHSLNQTRQNQFINSRQERLNIDILAAAAQDDLICLYWISVRNGRYIGDKSFIPANNSADYSLKNCTEYFLSQHYLGTDKPDEIVTNFPINTMIKTVLNQEQAKKIQFATGNNVIGERKKWLLMAEKNAAAALIRALERSKNQQDRRQRLENLLNISPLHRIECFDISHTFGEETVGSCVVYEQDAMRPEQYRRFNIKGITGGDDFAAMSQVLTRRYQKIISEVPEGKNTLPDLVLIDGGQGQISAALKVWDKLRLTIPMVGVAKGPERKPGLEQLVMPAIGKTVQLKPDDPALLLIQTVRDEAHRFAITGHRRKRDLKRTKSKLDAIPLIGSKRKKALLIRFGGLKGVESAGIEELAQVEGINTVIAQKIYRHLHSY